MIRCRETCTARHDGPRDEATADGWLVVSPDPAVPALCPVHASMLIPADAHVFGPEYEQLASRVPVDGDYLITDAGIRLRWRDKWSTTIVYHWPAKVDAA